MKFEVVEDGAPEGAAWIVRRDGVEIARHREQELALADIAERLREARDDDADLSYSLAMRYQVRA
jgi:hypothetical protein